MLLGGVALPLGWLLAIPAAGAPAAATHTVKVSDVAEAWYADSPVDVCSTPLGCPPDQAPTSPYPADTLHVGVAGGQETARSYLLPDLSLVPFGAHITAATMTLPVATGNTDGTASADTAHLVACLATQAFTDGAEGSSQAPPKVNCSVESPATYDAKNNVFTVDLTPMTDAWAHGALPLGIAVLPDLDTTQPTDAWHVTINGRKRAASPHVSTTVTFVPPAPTSGSGSTGGTTSGTTTGVQSARPPAAPPAIVAPAPSSVAPVSPPVSPPIVASPQQSAPVAQPAAFVTGVPQPVAFVIPIVLLMGAVFFGRVFTRDATPMAARS